VGMDCYDSRRGIDCGTCSRIAYLIPAEYGF
jgi:hypothetical protein